MTMSPPEDVDMDDSASLPAMCVLAAIGLLAPRTVLVLMWLINGSFVLEPFSGTSVPNPVFRCFPSWAYCVFPPQPSAIAGLRPRSEACRRSVACWWC